MKILKVDHLTWVTRLIRDEIQAFDELTSGSQLPNDVTDLDDFKKFSIGSKLPSCTLEQMLLARGAELIFTNFRARLNKFWSTELGYQVRLADDTVVSLLQSMLYYQY